MDEGLWGILRHKPLPPNHRYALALDRPAASPSPVTFSTNSRVNTVFCVGGRVGRLQRFGTACPLAPHGCFRQGHGKDPVSQTCMHSSGHSPPWHTANASGPLAVGTGGAHLWFYVPMYDPAAVQVQQRTEVGVQHLLYNGALGHSPALPLDGVKQVALSGFSI